MLELFLMRHAKSSWQSDVPTDHERPLNNRGRRDAPLMGQRMMERNDSPAVIHCSSSVRGTSTALLVAQEIGIADGDVRRLSEGYTFDAEEVLYLVRQFDDSETSIMLVGHNPAFTVLANQFSQQAIANVPTCGLLKLVSKAEHWTEFKPENTELLYFDYPKNDLVIKGSH